MEDKVEAQKLPDGFEGRIRNQAENLVDIAICADGHCDESASVHYLDLVRNITIALLAAHQSVRADTLSQPNPSVAVLTNPERVDLQRTIAESSITDGELSNNDIDSLVDLFDAWLERRPSSLNT
jgi:hypothetical protein